MTLNPIPNPREHPNGYAGISSGMIAALLVYEAHVRLGIDLTELEAGAVVALVTSLVLFLGKKVAHE
jgi:hypothetical protein